MNSVSKLILSCVFDGLSVRVCFFESVSVCVCVCVCVRVSWFECVCVLVCVYVRGRLLLYEITQD